MRIINEYQKLNSEDQKTFSRWLLANHFYLIHMLQRIPLGLQPIVQAAMNKCLAQSNKSPDCNGAYKLLMHFKSWLIAINTAARDNADACALAPL